MNVSVERQPSLAQKIQARLAASRFLTFSLLLHATIVLFVGTAVLYTHIRVTDFAPEGGVIVSEEESKLPPQQVNPSVDPVNAPPPSAVAPSMDEYIASTSRIAPSTVPSFSMASIKDPTRMIAQEVGPEGPTLSPTIATIRKNLPLSMSGRPGGAAHDLLMTKNKMAKKSEEAVVAGLRWLKQHQSQDGSWAAQDRTAMTGLAVLCFLGHGETPEAPEFGPTVKRGVDWLLRKGLEAQGALAGAGGNFSQTDVYEHAIGTYALSEYYAMTKDERVKDVLTQAVTYIVQGQAPDGGWMYRYEKLGDSDTSVTGWQIQALKAAHLAELNIPGVDDALNKAMLDLKRVQNEKGAFGYHSAADARYSLTGVGVLCTYFWKGERDKSMKEGFKYLMETTEKENPVEYKGAKADLYAWYYDTQACLLYGGDIWSKWNRWFQGQIADNQSPDGSWPPTGNKAPIGNVENEALEVGPYYRTSLCVLMLEVFYRYVPAGQ